MSVLDQNGVGPSLTAAGDSVAERLVARPWSDYGVWGDEENQTLICRQVKVVTHDVKTFLFEAVQPALFRHEPGQFVTLQLEIDGSPVNRCYTIATPPTRPHLLGITVKRQPGGLVSNWLHDNMVRGRKLTADGPFGVFTITRHEATGQPAKYLFLSGGSGITPLMSMTRTLQDLGSDADVVFVHSARTPADIIFRSELQTIATEMPGVRVVPICERDAPGEPWSGFRGFLSAEMLQLIAPDFAERTVFCCGPAPYMAAVRRILDLADFDLENYHQESFTFEDLAMREFTTSARASRNEAATAIETDGSASPATIHDAAPAVASADNGVGLGDIDEPEASATSYSVEFVRSGQTFTCSSDEFVLDAAFAAGLFPASSCGEGMCGTCKTTKLDGEVEMQHNGGIRPREIAQGKLLICCSRPLSDLRIDA